MAAKSSRKLKIQKDLRCEVCGVVIRDGEEFVGEYSGTTKTYCPNCRPPPFR